MPGKCLCEVPAMLSLGIGDVIPERISLSTPTVCVPPLDKGIAIACEARLPIVLAVGW